MTLNSSIFSSAIAGLNNTFAQLAKGSTTGGLTLEQITNPDTEKVNTLSLNSGFVQYLSTNFSSIDKDGDGEITSSDLSKLMQNISKSGLSYDEICQLGASGAIPTDMLNTVLTYFSEIDKDHDGKITSSEIAAYQLDADRHEMENKYKSFQASSISTFYADENATNDYTSVLDYKYPTKNNS